LLRILRIHIRLSSDTEIILMRLKRLWHWFYGISHGGICWLIALRWRLLNCFSLINICNKLVNHRIAISDRFRLSDKILRAIVMWRLVVLKSFKCCRRSKNILIHLFSFLLIRIYLRFILSPWERSSYAFAQAVSHSLCSFFIERFTFEPGPPVAKKFSHFFVCEYRN